MRKLRNMRKRLSSNSYFRRIVLHSKNLQELLLQIFFCLFIFVGMFRQILKGYSQILSSILKVLALLAICALVGIALVYPLWYFATKLPQTYTFCVTATACILFLIWLVLKIRSAGLKNSLIFFTKFLIIASTVLGFVFLVFAGKRLFTIFEIIFAFFLYGFVSFIFKPSQKTKDFSENDSL